MSELKKGIVHLSREKILGGLGLTENTHLHYKEGEGGGLEIHVTTSDEAEWLSECNAGIKLTPSITSVKESSNHSLKERKTKKNVVVFGQTFRKAKSKFDKLAETFKYEIGTKSLLPQRLSFETEDMLVESIVFSNSHRGRRFDEIYVDKNLSISDLDTIKTMRKNDSTKIFYY